MHEFISGLYSRMFWPKQLCDMIRKWINLKASSFILLFWGSFGYARSFRDPRLFHNLFSISMKKSLEFSEIVLHQTKMFLLREKKLLRPEEGVRSQGTGVTNNGNWTWVLRESSQWAKLILSHFSSPRNLSLIYKLYKKNLKDRSLSVPNRMLKSKPLGSNVQNVWCEQLL